MLPFGQHEFYALFARYHAAIWPVPVVAYLFGLLSLAGLLWPRLKMQRAAWFLLGALWLWTGASYFYMVLGGLQPPLRIFGFLFLVQGGALLGYAFNEEYAQRAASRGRTALGLLLAVTALAVYPALGLAAGHAYPAAPSFGVTPCPLTIFTFGLLLLSPTRISGWFYAIPAIWAVIGGSATLLLGVPQDILLPLSAAVALLARNWGSVRPATSGYRQRGGHLAGQH